MANKDFKNNTLDKNAGGGSLQDANAEVTLKVKNTFLQLEPTGESSQGQRERGKTTSFLDELDKDGGTDSFSRLPAPAAGEGKSFTGTFDPDDPDSQAELDRLGDPMLVTLQNSLTQDDNLRKDNEIEMLKRQVEQLQIQLQSQGAAPAAVDPNAVGAAAALGAYGFPPTNVPPLMDPMMMGWGGYPYGAPPMPGFPPAAGYYQGPQDFAMPTYQDYQATGKGSGNSGPSNHSGKKIANKPTRKDSEEGVSEQKKTDKPEHEWTTTMLRNLPGNFTRNNLQELLDTYDKTLQGKYDFIYLPHDFQRQAGLGYAFVNWVDHDSAVKAKNVLEGYKDWTMSSQKTLEVVWGQPLQGKEAHIDRYRNSPVMFDGIEEIFKPVIFENGKKVDFPVPTKKIRPPRHKKPGNKPSGGNSVADASID